MINSEEFVDLYAMLALPGEAGTEQIRQRIQALYGEAQQNLEHHNFRKRFYYQQLYELHLPQAHAWLLEANRRAYYAQCLAAYRSGQPFPPTPQFESAASATGAPSAGAVDLSDTAPLPALRPEYASPDKPELQWRKAPPATKSKAKGHPETKATPAAQPAASSSAAPSSSITFNFDSPPVVNKPSGETPQVAPPLARHPIAPPLPQMSASEVERRRDYKRRELIKHELISAGRTWGWGSGVSAFCLGFMILAVAQQSWRSAKHPPLGLSSTDLIIGGLVLVVVCAFLYSYWTVRNVRRHLVATLSKMPYDELLARCAR